MVVTAFGLSLAAIDQQKSQFNSANIEKKVTNGIEYVKTPLAKPVWSGLG